MTIDGSLDSTSILTAIMALSGVILIAVVNWFMNKKQFQGLVISQSRINWIQDVRKVSATFLSHMTNCKSLLKQMEEINNEIMEQRKYIVTYINTWPNQETGEDITFDDDHPDFIESNKYYKKIIEGLNIEIRNLTQKLIEEQDKFNEYFQLLILYLPKNPNKEEIDDEHARIQNILYELKKIIDSSIRNKEKVDHTSFDQNLNNLTDEISNYLKQEWDNAKLNR